MVLVIFTVIGAPSVWDWVTGQAGFYFFDVVARVVDSHGAWDPELNEHSVPVRLEVAVLPLAGAVEPYSAWVDLALRVDPAAA